DPEQIDAGGRNRIEGTGLQSGNVRRRAKDRGSAGKRDRGQRRLEVEQQVDVAVGKDGFAAALRRAVHPPDRVDVRVQQVTRGERPQLHSLFNRLQVGDDLRNLRVADR